MTPGFKDIIGAAEADRRDLFLAAALRLGTPIQNVEKDFWGCACVGGHPGRDHTIRTGGQQATRSTMTRQRTRLHINPKTRKPPVSIFYDWDSIRKKVGLGEVQKLLGHHDPKVTMRYAHLSPGALIEAANIVGNLMGRRPVVATLAVA